MDGETVFYILAFGFMIAGAVWTWRKLGQDKSEDE